MIKKLFNNFSYLISFIGFYVVSANSQVRRAVSSLDCVGNLCEYEICFLLLEKDVFKVITMKLMTVLYEKLQLT